MKQLMIVAALVGILALALTTTAFAQGPVQGQGTQSGIHTPGTGLMQPGAGYGPRGGGMAMAGRGGAPGWAGQPDEVEAVLGMTEAQIQAERLAGKSLVQIADAKGVSAARLQSTILDAKKADLDKLVADGKLTQAQADFAYSRMQTQVPVMINRTTTGPAFGQGSQATTGMCGGRWNR
jgi:hypothetical protein